MSYWKPKGFDCACCHSSECQLVRWCGDEHGWCCPGCVESPMHGKLWRAWKAHQAKHQEERQRERRVETERFFLR